jgi:hypothetical protein
MGTTLMHLSKGSDPIYAGGIVIFLEEQLLLTQHKTSIETLKGR